jgi:hypothetical protein
MKHIATLILALSAAGASAAKFKTLEKAEAFATHEALVKGFCDAVIETNLDCWSASYKIISKKPSEAWSRTVKQIVHATGAPYVEEVFAKVVDTVDDGQTAIDQYTEVVLAAGWDRAFADSASDEQQAAEADLYERIANDVDESQYVVVRGGESGAFSSSHQFLVLIDTEAKEVFFFGAGYSE